MDVDLSTEELAEEAEGLSSDDAATLKRDALASLYLFSKGICGRKDVIPGAHGAFCKFFDSHKKLRRLGLMPRTHLKTTSAVVDDSARLALIDPNEFRGLILGETATKAEANLRQIRGLFEKNPLVRALWPEAVPQRFSGPGVIWSTTMAQLPRETVYREPTWTALGVGGSSGVGWHFTRIKADDLIGLEAMKSPAKMAEAITYCDNIEPLLVDQHFDIIDWIGTRWSVHDLYAHLMEIYGSAIAVFAREAIENGEIIFPNLHTWEEYERLMTKSPALWFAQYCNNPLTAGGTDFDATKVQSFKFSLDGKGVIFVDPLTRYEKSWRLDELFVVTLGDPNSGSRLAPDTAAIVTAGQSPDSEVFVLESRSSRWSPSEYVDEMWKTAFRWRSKLLAVEKAAQQTAFHYLQQKVDESDAVHFRLTELKPASRDKEWRIRDNLDPIINSSQLFILPGQTELRKQIREFPQNCQYDNALVDELDALAYGPDVFRKPMRSEDLKARTKRIKMVLRHRSRITGY